MRKTAILLMFLTIISKIFGFARDVTLSYFYGASNISDAYLISVTIPMVIFSFIGTGISTGYIPLYSQIEKEYGIEKGNRYTNNLINILMVICTIIIIFGLIFTEQLVKIFASGFEGETLKLAVKFTRIGLFAIYFSAVKFVFNGFLQLKGNYAVPALLGFPMNFFIIMSIFLSSKTGNEVFLAIGTVVAAISEVVVLAPFIRKKGYRYQFVLDTKDKYIKRMAQIALPVIIGVSINQINVLVDKTIASSIVVGGISALNYAEKLNGFIQGIFVVSISTAMYPMISKMAANNNIEGLKDTVSEAINSISLLVIPATVGAMVFAEPVVKFLFGRGAFDIKAISMTSEALFFYSIGMIGFGFREIISRAFYSQQDTKTPMINATISLFINIALNIILSRYLGIGGLALATSISALFCTFLLFISFRKKMGPFGMKRITISFIKISISSVVMGLAAKLSFDFLVNSIGSNLSLIIAVIIGAVVYFVMIYILKVEEANNLIDKLKGKFNKGTENV